MAQLVALMSGVVLGGVAEVVGSNLARGKIFTASIGSVDSLYPSVYIYIYIYMYIQGDNSLLSKRNEKVLKSEQIVCSQRILNHI